MDSLNELAFLIDSLIVFSDAQKDALIRSVSKIYGSETAEDKVKAYSEMCGILCEKNKTLSRYVFELAKYDANEFMRRSALNLDVPDFLNSCAVHDAAVLSKIAGLRPAGVKAELMRGYEDSLPALVEGLPDFETGDCTLTVEKLREEAKKDGTGIFAKYRAFMFDGEKGITPVENPDPVRLSELKRYEIQRRKVVENTMCFIDGKTANNVLLYGDRGTGKSSTVKALLNEFCGMGLRLVQTDKKSLAKLGVLIEELTQYPQRFIIFVDDLTFGEEDESYAVLKAVLEGSLISRPENVLIYVTTNRRHLVKETFSSRDGDDIHRSDTIHEKMSLSDRFGISVTFSSPNKNDYEEIVRELAADRGLELDEVSLVGGAERFALAKGGRSPRLAKQYVDFVQSRYELGLDPFN